MLDDSSRAGSSLTIHFLRELPYLHFLQHCRQVKGVFQLFHPIMRKRRENINQAARNINKRDFSVEGCRILLKYLQPFRITALIKEAKKNCAIATGMKYFCVFKGWYSECFFSSPGESTLYWQIHTITATRQHHILVVLWIARLNEINLCFLIRIIMLLLCTQTQSGFRDH